VERIGTIVEVKENTAVVKLNRHVACEGCGRCGGLLGNADRRDHLVEVSNTGQAEVGQKVYVTADYRQTLFIAFMLYMVPLFAFITGLAGWLYLAPELGFPGNQELPAAAAGFALMVPVYIAIRQWDRRVKRTGRYRPEITGLVEDDASAEDDNRQQ